MMTETLVCGKCGQPGRRIRYRTFAHLGPMGNWTGPSAHAFEPVEVDERVDERLTERRWFERTHRDEVRHSSGHRREMQGERYKLKGGPEGIKNGGR